MSQKEIQKLVQDLDKCLQVRVKIVREVLLKGEKVGNHAEARKALRELLAFKPILRPLRALAQQPRPSEKALRVYNRKYRTLRDLVSQAFYARFKLSNLVGEDLIQLQFPNPEDLYSVMTMDAMMAELMEQDLRVKTRKKRSSEAVAAFLSRLSEKDKQLLEEAMAVGVISMDTSVRHLLRGSIVA